MRYKEANRTSLLGLAGVLLAVAGAAFGGTVIYVDADAPCGNGGLCWPDAYKYLQDALSEAASAQKPVQIRVAGGVYRPDESAADPNGSGDRAATFQLMSGVTIVGGYAGSGEADPNVRDFVAYETILSGDLDGNDVELVGWDWDSIDDYVRRGGRYDNSRTVVTGSSADGSAVLDGFTITGGHADCSVVLGGAGNNGGGMYNESGSPTLINCTFRGNVSSVNGGGSCSHPSSPSVECGFLPAAAGGAVYNSNSSAMFENCTFTENIVFSGNVTCAGGGMYNFNSDPVLTNCEFNGNVVTGYDDVYYGGGMYNRSSSPTLTDCVFTGNMALGGAWGGMVNVCGSNAVLRGCRFEGNLEGGMNITRSSPVLTDCTFVQNSGGALSIQSYSDATLTNCTFRENSGEWGGAIEVSYAQPTLRNCEFIANSAGEYGGAICYSCGDNADVIGCAFYGNSAGVAGGAVYNNLSELTMTNCLFSGNQAAGAPSSGGGGAVCSYHGSTTLTNCTFAGNSATRGNALGFRVQEGLEPSNLEARNCIFRDGGDEVRTDGVSTVSITYSNVEGGWPGAGNIDADPSFADADGADDVVGTEDDELQPVPGSPCIDAGDNSAVPASVETDIAGRVRIMDGVVDMGAHESQSHIYVDAANGDDFNDGLTPATALASIQAGINSATTGYTVWVYPGVYTEDGGINFLGKAITVRGVGDAPVLEAPGGYAVSFFSREGSDSVLKNFIIRNSFVGIFTAPGAPTIKNVTVVGNTFGAAAYADMSPDVVNCIFWDNIDGDLHGCIPRYSWVEEDIERQPVAGLICHWEFDEGEGGLAHDSIGGSHLSLRHPSWTEGVIGGALEFDGDRAEAEDQPGQQIYTNQITLSVWINLSRDVGVGTIISKEADRQNSWALLVHGEGYSGSPGNRIVFRDSDGASQWYDCMSPTDLSMNQWHHICVTDIGGSIRMYLDGELDHSSDEGYGVPSEILAGIKIGGDMEKDFIGLIDDVRIYNRALAAEEIGDLYDNGLLGYGLSADPLFADASGGDYHLRSERGRYWAERDLWVLDSVSSPCIDGGDPNESVYGERTPNGGRINIGAYGGTAYASMSECWSRADYNCDGVVNMMDFAHVADRWLQRAEWIE